MQNQTPQLLKISGLCAIFAPLLLLGSDLYLLATGRMFEWSIGLWLAFVLFVPAVIGLTYHLVSNGSRLALAGGILAFFGAMAGASMQAMFRTHAVLLEQGAVDVVEQLRGTIKLVASTQMIGITWPIGLILVSIAIVLLDRTRWLTALLLTAGAIAFPIGRIAGSQAAVILSGAFFIPAFGMVGLELLRRANSFRGEDRLDILEF
jgi:hypothetical protein